MAEIDREDFKEIQQFHRENYPARPRYDTLLEYVQEAHPILEQVAADRDLITYGDLREQLGTNRGYISPVIGTISHLEMRKGQPPLSIVVVLSGSDQPSEGFMDLFSELDEEHPYPHLLDDEAMERILQDVYEQHSD